MTTMLTHPIAGRGWLLHTLSCLALGVDPRDADDRNPTTLRTLLDALAALNDLGLGPVTADLHGMNIHYHCERMQYCTLTIGVAGTDAPAFEIRWEEKSTRAGRCRLAEGGLFGATVEIARWLTRDDEILHWSQMSTAAYEAE